MLNKATRNFFISCWVQWYIKQTKLDNYNLLKSSKFTEVNLSNKKLLHKLYFIYITTPDCCYNFQLIF